MSVEKRCNIITGEVVAEAPEAAEVAGINNNLKHRAGEEATEAEEGDADGGRSSQTSKMEPNKNRRRRSRVSNNA